MKNSFYHGDNVLLETFDMRRLEILSYNYIKTYILSKNIKIKMKIGSMCNR